MRYSMIALSFGLLLVAGTGCGTTTPVLNSNTINKMNMPTTSFTTGLRLPIKDTSGFTTTASGLQYQDLNGIGDEARAKTGDQVSVHYVGMLPNGKQFDSSLNRTPFEFTLGAGDVIQGWDEGIVGMSIGQERLLVIPPDLAYGEAGIAGVIPANATLQFQVRLEKLN